MDSLSIFGFHLPTAIGVALLAGLGQIINWYLSRPKMNADTELAAVSADERKAQATKSVTESFALLAQEIRIELEACRQRDAAKSKQIKALEAEIDEMRTQLRLRGLFSEEKP